MEVPLKLKIEDLEEQLAEIKKQAAKTEKKVDKIADVVKKHDKTLRVLTNFRRKRMILIRGMPGRGETDMELRAKISQLFSEFRLPPFAFNFQSCERVSSEHNAPIEVEFAGERDVRYITRKCHYKKARSNACKGAIIELHRGLHNL